MSKFIQERWKFIKLKETKNVVKWEPIKFLKKEFKKKKKSSLGWKIQKGGLSKN